MKISPDTVWCPVDGELVLLNYKAGTYYGLNQIGSHIWQLLTEDLPLPVVIAQIQDSYEVEPAAAEAEVRRLVSELLTAGLLVEGSSTGPDHSLAVANRQG